MTDRKRKEEKDGERRVSLKAEEEVFAFLAEEEKIDRKEALLESEPREEIRTRI